MKTRPSGCGVLCFASPGRYSKGLYFDFATISF